MMNLSFPRTGKCCPSYLADGEGLSEGGRLRPITTGLLIAVLLLQGCGAPGAHSHGGQLVAEYPARRKPAFGWTRIPAVYVLYSQRDRPEGQPTATKANVGWKLTAVQLE